MKITYKMMGKKDETEPFAPDGYTCIGWLRADNHTTANTTSDQE